MIRQFISTTAATKICAGFGFLAQCMLFQLSTSTTAVLAQTTERGAYQMPYTRYEADVAVRN